MTWRYMAHKETVTYDIGHSEEDWTIHEYYESDSGDMTGITTGSISPGGTSRQELIQDLRRMLSDLEDGLYWDDDEGRVVHIAGHKWVKVVGLEGWRALIGKPVGFDTTDGWDTYSWAEIIDNVSEFQNEMGNTYIRIEFTGGGGVLRWPTEVTEVCILKEDALID